MSVDILDIKNLPEDQQKAFFEKKSHLLKFASEGIIAEMLNRNSALPLSVNEFLLLGLNNRVFNYKNINKFLNQEELFDLFDSFPVSFFYYFYEVSPLFGVEHINLLKSKAQFINDDLKKSQFLELCDMLKRLIVSRHDHYGYYYDAKGYQIAKLLFNNKVLEYNEISVLKEYIKTFDKKLLIEILSNAFGEHVKIIFQQRPELDLYSLTNINCLDKAWVENFGIGFVHYLLNYNFDYLNKIIGDLVKNKFKMSKFKILYKFMIENHSLNDVTVLYDSLELYCEHQSFFDNNDIETFTEYQKENLSFLINDNPLLWSYIEKPEDLDNYMKIRDEFYLKMFNNFMGDMNSFVLQYLTGIYPKHGSITVNKLDIQNIYSVYNVESIVQSLDVGDAIGLNEDEKGLLLLLYKLMNNNYDSSIYNEILEIIFEDANLNPSTFKTTFAKIKKYYINIFKDQVSGNKELSNLKKYNIDGVCVVEYNGEPFNLLCSVTSLDIGIHGKKHLPLYGKNLLYDWLYREDAASSTISTHLNSSDVDFLPLPTCKDHIIFVFDNDVDIIAYGGSDIASSHGIREPYHKFDFSIDTFMQFSDMNAFKKNVLKSLEYRKLTNSSKFLSEVAILRKQEDVNQINAIPLRTMPIGIYVTGEITAEILETAKIFNQYYKANNLGEFKIIKINSNKYVIDYTKFITESNDDVQLISNAEWYKNILGILERKR